MPTKNKMEILYNLEKKTNLSLALGFFDGIHKGHKKVIENAVQFAKQNNTKSAVISFVDHPSSFILKRKPEYIIPLKDKIEKIQNLDVDYLYLLNFDNNLANMSKENYFNFLLKLTNPIAITTGFNHFFGKDKKGDTKFLETECKKNNIKYTKILPVKVDNKIISSTTIRQSLMNADFGTVKNMTNYDFYIKGEIIKGNQIGTKLGYKTINIKYPDNIIKLPYGVYCTKTKIDNKIYNSITNWGVKPTINNNNSPVMETHILNFNKEIYGQTATIIFFKKIRDEKKFDTLEDLKTQIKKDIELCNYQF